jgi:hypothetical protein
MRSSNESSHTTVLTVGDKIILLSDSPGFILLGNKTQITAKRIFVYYGRTHRILVEKL